MYTSTYSQNILKKTNKFRIKCSFQCVPYTIGLRVCYRIWFFTNYDDRAVFLNRESGMKLATTVCQSVRYSYSLMFVYTAKQVKQRRSFVTYCRPRDQDVFVLQHQQHSQLRLNAPHKSRPHRRRSQSIDKKSTATFFRLLLWVTPVWTSHYVYIETVIKFNYIHKRN